MESQLNWMKYCQDHIIKRMRSDRYGSLFSNPVLESSDSIIPPSVKESYRLVIKNPMDYKTIKVKLESGIYSKPEEFYDDMKLIFDNCMTFNPPVGASKWAHDAAISNFKKFAKIWDVASKTVYKLYENDTKPISETGTFEDTSQAPSSVLNDFQVPIVSSTNYLNESDLNSARMNETSEVPLSPNDSINLFSEPLIDSALDLHCNFSSDDVTPRNEWSFRLNLQSIQEYKVRNGFLNQTPEINSFSSYLDPKPVIEPNLPIDTPTSVNYDAYQSDVMNTVHSSVDVQNFEPYNDSSMNTVDGAMDYEDLEPDPEPAFPIEVPEILSKNDDGVVCVSFFSESECNRLFPNCNIIGMNTDKPDYNISDVSIRYIYNQLYMNDINNLKFDQKKEIDQNTPVLDEEYKLKENRSRVKINFSSLRDTSYNYFSPNCLNYYRRTSVNKAQDTDDTQLAGNRKQLDEHVFCNSDTEDEGADQADKPKGNFKKLISKFVGKGRPSDSNLSSNQVLTFGGTNGDNFKSDLKYSNGVNNGNKLYSSETPEHISTLNMIQLGDISDEIKSVSDEVFDLFIDIDSNSILNVSEAEGLLERNLFSRVSVKGEFFKIYEKPNMSLLCGNKGYFKLDESDFVFENADMKHIRIFFFNCSKSKVRVSSKRSTFTELVLQNRYNFSLVSNLHNEFKLGNVSNLPFFTLPNSTPICFSKQQDILYRFQQIHNSLPVKLLALHIISTQ